MQNGLVSEQIPVFFPCQCLRPCHLTCTACDLMKNDPSFVFLKDASLNSICAFRSVYSIQTQSHVRWQFVVYDNLTGVSHGWIFIQQLSRCDQARISKSYLSCVKSVQPASNQPLHPQGNIMWHLSKPSQHVTPPTQSFFKKSGIFHAAHICLSNPC